jgi:hypothetical protein
MKMYGGEGVYFHAFYLGTRMEVSGQLHATSVLTEGIEPWCPLDMGTDGRKSRSEHCTETKFCFPYKESNPGLSVVEFVS